MHNIIESRRCVRPFYRSRIMVQQLSTANMTLVRRALQRKLNEIMTLSPILTPRHLTFPYSCGR